MGTEIWLIFFGVAIMTLIIMDGKRRRKKSRAALRQGQRDILKEQGIARQARVVTWQGQGEVLGLKHEAWHPPMALVHPVNVGLPWQQEKASYETVDGGSHIGAATSIQGMVIANEQVLVKGYIDGAVVAERHLIHLTTSSSVTATIQGRLICIDGTATGTLSASERVILMSGARVQGSINAMQLECWAGARFSGSVGQYSVAKLVS